MQTKGIYVRKNDYSCNLSQENYGIIVQVCCCLLVSTMCMFFCSYTSTSACWEVIAGHTSVWEDKGTELEETWTMGVLIDTLNLPVSSVC